MSSRRRWVILRTVRWFLAVPLLAASGTALAGPFTTAAGQLGAIDNPGLIPIGVPAVTVTGYITTGYFNSPAANYSYTLDSTNPTSGFTPDFHWLGSGGTTPSAGAMWQFSSLATEYYHYTAIDHLPLPNEALESSLWGSNDGGSTWILGTIAEVYTQGWNAAAIADDGATRWTFSVPVDLIANVVGINQGVVGGSPPYIYSDGDYETDAVMQRAVPEVPSAALLLLAVPVLAWARKRIRTERPDMA